MSFVVSILLFMAGFIIGIMAESRMIFSSMREVGMHLISKDKRIVGHAEIALDSEATHWVKLDK